MASFCSSCHRVLLLVLCLASVVSSDLSSDEKECSNQWLGLETCVPYAQGKAKAPTPDCCNGLKQVLANSPKCLCMLIKDINDPQLSIKLNSTLALTLPSLCSASTNISQCPKLLNLPPNSTDAEIFKQAANAAQGNSTSSGSVGVSTQASSGGSGHRLGGRRWAKRLLLVVLSLLLLT